ncbi:TPA: virulence factor [Burkholderia aenigmatica]|nr:virulence factor [Burkholderia aenigmatica]HDR9518038.1 virulence factor [Burkholderia aenigmatica]HDR9594742.1 virulence factor [Burkholderia aenigmatica]HDR9602277.1 virulence factor [Burkholderia aenigmatica]HDR9609144.1 virulence factor [Burkholderia aenigmatica]
MKRLLIVPTLEAVLAFVVSIIVTVTPARADTVTQKDAAVSNTNEGVAPFVAQVVGLEWLNPLQRRDYPTEWQVLWTMGLAKPNKNDDMVRTDPKSFTTLQSVAGVAYGNQGAETFQGFYHKYVSKLLGLFGDRYVMNAKYFYTVKSRNKDDWRELAGIRVEFAVPDRLDAGEAQAYLQQSIVSEFNIGNKYFLDLWSKNTPPDVHVNKGGANAGFTSLNRALDYLQANPDKSAWVMNWDAPSFPPKDAQINENMVVLFLVGPNFKTEREPLAWIGRAATGNVKDYEAKAGTTRTVQAWKATIDSAARNAGVTVPSLNFVVHDAGRGGEAASERIGALSQTLTEVLPDYNFSKQTFNTPALLGPMGAGTALTDVVLAIGRANHFGEKVLVAGTTDAQHPTAVVVVPPSKVTAIDPDKDWFRARGENNAYLPWWGRRHDTDYGMQGYSY